MLNRIVLFGGFTSQLCYAAAIIAGAKLDWLSAIFILTNTVAVAVCAASIAREYERRDPLPWWARR